jgi:hypothetical protein
VLKKIFLQLKMHIAFYIIVAATIWALIRKMLVRFHIIKEEIRPLSDITIFFVMVIPFNTNWLSTVTQILNTADDPDNINIALIITCTTPEQVLQVPKYLQHQVKMLHVRKRKGANTAYYLNLARDQLMGSEDYLAVFNGTELVPSWDTICKSILVPDTIITCPPCDSKLRPTFPTIKTKDANVCRMANTKPVFNQEMCTTPSIAWCDTFIFMEHHIAQEFNFIENQLEQTKSMHVDLTVPCVPCVLRGNYRKDEFELNDVHPGLQCGLTKTYSDMEAIQKFGSLESARLQYEFGEKD